MFRVFNTFDEPLSIFDVCCKNHIWSNDHICCVCLVFVLQPDPCLQRSSKGRAGQLCSRHPRGLPDRTAGSPPGFPGSRDHVAGRERRDPGIFFSKFLEGSFSAVSKPSFGSQYAFCSIFRLYKMCTLFHCSDLQNLSNNWL